MGWIRHRNPLSKAATLLFNTKDENVQDLLNDWRNLVREYNNLSAGYITIEQEVIRLRHENQFMIRLIEAQLNKEIQ